ncbi:hypothetical protein FISHEDRAFT_75746 [Fistulina hepatica ATCC 64428]|uniref:Uncharacterized protein n=1 Tax=Fistulina hepatica ATCC 64428 TaxID=1128425 RepID=A0A0D7A8S9_9AGAR|nr:hypothetical protein FISHEDRAFT_75746 [Fistulina hepatica ATCC 64428]
MPTPSAALVLDSPAMTASSSALMHAVVASFSPEVRTLDSILRSRSSPRLPPETLLSVRAFLQPAVTAHFVNASADALFEYETSVRASLCTDCLTYNQEVYGTDVWSWDFAGPCACYHCQACTGSPQEHLSERFANPTHWLESHLSRECHRLAPSLSSAERYASGPGPSIWDVVSSHLDEYQCDVVVPTAQSGRRTPINHGGRLRSTRHDCVCIVPKHYRRTPSDRVRFDDDRWSTETALRRVDRDLGISTADEMSVDIAFERATPAAKLARPMRCSGPQCPFATIQSYPDPAALFVGISDLIVTSLAILLAVLCYYIRPTALRAF